MLWEVTKYYQKLTFIRVILTERPTTACSADRERKMKAVPDLGWSHGRLHKTKIERRYFIETFVSLKS
jgi:hypothetical protein